MSRGRRSRPAVGSEQGFTLVELLVAILASAIVVGALYSLVFLSMIETSRTFTRLDATQQARTMLESIENELHSTCVADQVTPIQGGGTGTQDSTATQLVFLSQEGTAASLTPVEHDISFANGTLSDTTYAVSGGTAPNWTFSSTPSGTTTLLRNVSQRVVNATPVPVFKYFAYGVPTNSSNAPYTDSAGNDYMILLDGNTDVPGTNTLPANSPSPLATPLSATDAANTAEVVITLVVGPQVQANEVGSRLSSSLPAANDAVTDSVVLRLTPAANDDGGDATFNPCQ